MFHLSSNSPLGIPVETLWHSSFLWHLIRTIFASRLASPSAGILCHPVGGAVRWQISRSNKCNSVMSNVFESGGSPDDGNNFSHWSSNITRLDLWSLRRFLFNTCCNVTGGWKECKTFLRTSVPPSTSSRASLVPFVFSSDTVYTDDPEEAAEEAAAAAAMFVAY